MDCHIIILQRIESSSVDVFLKKEKKLEIIKKKDHSHKKKKQTCIFYLGNLVNNNQGK